jgi:ribose transport system permease protein
LSARDVAAKARIALPRPHLAIGVIRDYAIILALITLFIVLAASSDAFLTTRNLLNILDQWTPVCVMALGMTLLLVAGGFDLSIGSIFAMGGIVAITIANETSAELGLIAGVAAGALLGGLNGLMVSVFRMNVFVATIGTSIMITGIAVIITKGNVITTTQPGFDWLGNHKLLGVQLPIWVMGASVALCAFVLNWTTFGRYIRAIGGNMEAARLSGVRTQWVRMGTFVASGIGGGLAGAIVASRSISANATAFAGSQYLVWTAVLLGGNSMMGGEGAIWRTVVGVALLALIGNGFNLLTIDPLYQQVATGAILLTAVATDMLIRRRAE